MKDWLISRLREPSTWAAVFLVAQAWGLDFTVEQTTALTTLAVALFTLKEGK